MKRSSLESSKTLNTVLTYVFLILGALIMIFPFVWMLLTSSKTVPESMVFELTLKSAKQEDYDMAYYMIENAVIMEFERHRNTIERGKERLTSREYEWY